MADIKLLSIDETELSVRSKNALHRAGIHTVGEMLQYTKESLYNIPQLGEKSVTEILDVIKYYTENDFSESPSEESDISDVSEATVTVDLRLLSIDETSLSVRSRNALHKVGAHTVGDMMQYSEEKLYEIPMLGEKSVEEILKSIEYYMEQTAEETSSDERSFSEPMDEEHEKRMIMEYLSAHDVQTEVLESLSAKIYNILTFAGYDRLEKFVFMTEDELTDIEGMDRQSAKEVMKLCERYLRKNRDTMLSFGNRKKSEASPSLFFGTISDEKTKAAVLSYVKVNNIYLEDMPLSPRLKNKLMTNGYLSMSDMIFMKKIDVIHLGKIGENSVHEILSLIEQYRSEHMERIKRYLEDGDSSVLIDEEGILSLILDEYREAGFKGFSVSELKEALEEKVSVSEDRIKKALGHLVASGELEYVDYRCYKKYQKFSDFYLISDLDDREREVLKGRLEGKTLDEIGVPLLITRERVRQLVNRGIDKVRQQYKIRTGMKYFDEDYYTYLYTTYDFDRTEIAPWLGVSDEIRKYMEMISAKKGTLSLDMALKDTENLEVGLRLRIKNYLNRDCIYIDGKWVKKTRANLEAIVLRKCCTEDMTFSEFVDIFNGFLEKEEIPYDESIYYTEAVLSTRKNRFMEERKILWKFGEKFRYYDIDAQDYTELFETLNLDSYHDIELSAAKFFMDYPDLMEKYDIRDGYELHNLLKKVLETDRYGKYDELKIVKMPTLRFGNADRDGDLLNIMIENAPIRSEDLCELIHKEYGYEIRQVPSYLSHLSEYYYQGVYSVAHKEMSEERMSYFNAVLTKDFYTLDELKQIYIHTFENADKEEINSMNLKRMGFVVNSKYAIRHYSSAAKYIEAQLTKEDMFDISPLRKQFADYAFYYQTFSDLRKRLVIIEYEPNQFIHFRKLEKAGFTREMVRNFCDAVYETAEGGTFFTIHSLRKKGFDDEVFSFGFDDFFHGNLLLSDERFFCQKMFGTLFLRKDKKTISTKTLITDIVKAKRRIDLYDLEALLKEEYGCTNITPADLVYRTMDAELFYDTELQIFYEDEELYYQEIDETEGFYA